MSRNDDKFTEFVYVLTFLKKKKTKNSGGVMAKHTKTIKTKGSLY